MSKDIYNTSVLGKAEVIYKDGYKEVSNFTCKEDTGIVLDDYLGTDTKWIFHILKGSCIIIDQKKLLKENDFFVHDDNTGCISIYMLENTEFLIFSRNLNFFKALKDRDTQLNKILKMIEDKDINTFNHCNRVSVLTRKVATVLDYKGYDLFNIIFAAKFHDIGKIDLPNRILLKPEKLTLSEINIVKEHVNYGYKLVNPLNNPAIENMILQHHERIDGSGYPLGLKNEQINEGAQIIGLCDAFDVMTSLGSYNKEELLSESEACIELEKQSGKLFSKKLVEVFLENYNKSYADILYNKIN